MSEKYRPIYEISPEAQVRHGEIVLARELVDKESIELHANLLISNRTNYEWENLPDEDYNNAVTSLWEELRAAGDISEIDFHGNQVEVHAKTIARLLNGLRNDTPEWERKRRFAEVCEELTVNEVFCKVSRGELPEDTIVLTESDFPTDAEGATLQQIHDIGYRAGNKKGMARCYSFPKNEVGQYYRHLEQISHSNAVATDRTRNWYNQNASAVPLHATGALHEQAVTTKTRLPDGVVTFMKELDELGTGTLRYGDPIAMAAENERPSYDEIRSKSRENRAQECHFAQELADYETELNVSLHNGLITYNRKLQLFHKKQKEIIERILLQQPSYAADARGIVAAEHYRFASQAMQAGDRYAAEMHLNFAIKTRDTLAGGSCGGSGQQDKDSPLSPDNLNIINKVLDSYKTDLEARGEEDQYGSLEAECPHCHEKNKREKNEWIYECQKCGDKEIACGRTKPKNVARALLSFSAILEEILSNKKKSKRVTQSA